MPKRTDIKKILIIGSGPIVIGQACEFDYSGTQACKALREEGYEIVLINSNPATIMTDPETADRTYIEPIIPEMVIKILERERPQAILPTLGGQTGLNTAVAVAQTGILERLGVEMIGASLPVIQKAEGRELFRDAMRRIGLVVPRSGIARSLDEAVKCAEEIGFPIIIRPAYTLGGTGGGVVYNIEELRRLARYGLEASMVHEIMLEESVIGWKEFELEVMRDKMDNVVIICSIENFDPMGVHTGDSITVAPAQTLTDREYQIMRDASLAIIREIGVETGGSNIQFAINPKDGRMVVIEMNPRVSRSSALASKATGFPIAKIAAKLAVGYTLDEIPNDITKETYSSFEPTIDYCVVKIPRWTFEKFPGAEDVLTTSMKSVGEIMAIGRTFKEALLKGVRSLEIGRFFLGLKDGAEPSTEVMTKRLEVPNSERLFYIAHAMKTGWTIDEVARLTQIDPWFLYNIKEIVQLEQEVKTAASSGNMAVSPELLRKAKQTGFSDKHLADLTGQSLLEFRKHRTNLGISKTFKLVDTCAAEFEAYTPYYYSTCETEDEFRHSDKPKVVILGAGPNRIGQGIEFDYCCVHASFALREMGIESIMINSNPETVSTDYDTSDRLYFEPLTVEDVLEVVESEQPLGVIVQFGGQTPLNLTAPLAQAGVKILGTSPDSINRAEDRKHFEAMLRKLKLRQPENGTAKSIEEAVAVAHRIGYPVVVRPSYVLGGRAMEIVYDESSLISFAEKALAVSPEYPILIDHFLEQAVEVDVDAVSDGHDTVIGGIMEHIEEAGIHSGDSACVLPPYSLSEEVCDRIAEYTRAMAAELQVIGLMNVQYAIQADQVFVLEVNPRASRTVPFVSKATGVPLAKVATQVMMGRTLAELGLKGQVTPPHISVKEAVFPFLRFPGVDNLLGPEMKSTGEVMGIGRSFGAAFAKSQLAAGQNLPTTGKVLVTIHDRHKHRFLELVEQLEDLGFEILATKGTSIFLNKWGIANKELGKVHEPSPNVIDSIKSGEVNLVINIPFGRITTEDSYIIRRTTMDYGIPYTTTLAGARATIRTIRTLKKGDLGVFSLQEYHTLL
ncbi:MAG: carbamoyl-phosphate synthase large subunit [Deltaproteobacteria bacterium]|nr:carbamoyl-phosphate synthase large subunit [Deltaproteobacteria bacterium]